MSKKDVKRKIDKWIKNNPSKKIHIKFLKYMLKNACGRKKAIPIAKVRKDIAHPSKHNAGLQTQLLQEFRKEDNGFFVGSIGYGKNGGIFLVVDKKDAEEAAKIFKDRRESSNLRVETLANLYGSSRT